MMLRQRFDILLVLGLFAGLFMITSCERKFVCPAYQSMFILDPEVRLQTFSLFGEDSLPKTEVKVDKNQHLVIRPMNKRRKEKSLHSIPMVTIFPPAAIKDTVASNQVPLMDESVEPTNEDKSNTSEGEGF